MNAPRSLLRGAFIAAAVPNMVAVATRKELQELLGQDVRKVLITTIHKFGEAGSRPNERSNIIVMVDEAHRLESVRDDIETLVLDADVLEEILTDIEPGKRTREVVEAEKETDPTEERDRAKEALTELFQEAKNTNTHIIVERIVTDIDDIVKKVRCLDRQHTSQGERLVQKELRRTLLKYKLHTDQDLFDKAYGYIRQYY